MKAILFFLSLIYTGDSFSQSPWIINETFPANKLNWPLKNDAETESRVNDKGYEIIYKGKKSLNIYGAFSLSNNGDFFIEVTQKQLSENKDKGCGIIFGCNTTGTNQDGYIFIIAANGSYAISTLNGTNLTKPRFSPFINRAPGATNKLKVIQLGKRWLFFINNNDVDFIDAPVVFGPEAGFFVGSDSHVIFSSFKVYDLTAAKGLPEKSREPRYGVKFYENFNDNKNHWDVDNNTVREFKFDNGYIVQRKQDGFSSIWDHVSLDPSNDFVIELEMRHLAGANDWGFGLTWGAKDVDNLFAFKLTADGSFKVVKEEKGDYTNLIPYTDNEYINKGENVSNILTLKNIDKVWHFLINGKEVYGCPAKKFYGDRAGFILDDRQTVKISSLMAATLYYTY